MKRNRIACVLCILLILWLGVSAYFYMHHYVTIKTCPVYEKIDFGDEAIYITELRWDNFAKDESRTYNYEGTWHRFLLNLPMKIAVPYWKACYFYSKCYIKYDDTGYLTVKGLRLNDVSIFRERYELYIYTSEGSDCSGSQSSTSFAYKSNILSFYKQEKKLIPVEDLQNIWISIKDNMTGISKAVQVHPDWKSRNYSFFERQPDELEFAAEITAEKFTQLLQENNKENAEQLVLTNLRTTFPWHKLQHKYWDIGYIDNYMFYENNYSGFKDVYSYNISYCTERFPRSVVKAKQKIYLIYHAGAWKVIDVSPVINCGDCTQKEIFSP